MAELRRIKNLKGTGERDCGCGSWKNHWKRHTQEFWGFCAVDNCWAGAAAGAHVQLTDDDRTWWIVPLCDDHNNPSNESEMSIADWATLAPAARCAPR